MSVMRQNPMRIRRETEAMHSIKIAKPDAMALDALSAEAAICFHGSVMLCLSV